METYSKKISRELPKLAEVKTIALVARDRGSGTHPWTLVKFGILTAFRILCSRYRPQVIFIGDMSLWPLALVATLRRWRTGVAIAAHGTDISYSFRNGFRGRLYKLYLALATRLLARAVVIANSDATAAAVEKIGFRNTRVIPLATDIRGPEPSGRHNNTLLFVGRIIPLKGLTWFVEEVLTRLPENIRLQVAGPIQDNGEGAILNHPRVQYLGILHGADLVSAYASALAIVVPNIALPTGEYEGFGLVATEAAAAGGVVLAARLDGLRNAVIDNQTGFLLDSGNSGTWINKVLEIESWAQAQRKSFIHAAMLKCREQFSWGRVGRDTYGILLSQQTDAMRSP